MKAQVELQLEHGFFSLQSNPQDNSFQLVSENLTQGQFYRNGYTLCGASHQWGTQILGNLPN